MSAHVGTIEETRPASRRSVLRRLSWREREGRVALRPAVVGIVVTALAMATIGAVGFAALSIKPPRWWVVAADVGPDAQERGIALENAITNILHTRRATDEVWTVELTQREANAWLASRLVKWNDNRSFAWVPEKTEWRVVFEGGRVGVAVRNWPGTGGLVLSAMAEPRVADDGTMQLSSVRFAVGEMGVPNAFAGAYLSERPDIEAQIGEVAQRLGEIGRLDAPSEFAIDEARRVRILGIEATRGRLRLRCSIEKRSAGA